MKTILVKITITLLFLSICSCCPPFCRPPTGATDAELAYRWAPIHYQDVDQSGDHARGGRSDYIRSINFDDEWRTLNNWENIVQHPPLAAYCYYSIVKSSTHWFIIYAFYHPRDWAESSGGAEHENDLEGLLAIIKQDNTKFGELLAIVTVFHLDFYAYTPDGSSLQDGNEDIDGILSMEMYDGVLHPVTAQECRGHGLKAWPYVDIRGGDGIKYYPSLTVTEEPSSPNDRNVHYKLINIFEANGLWAQRENQETFAAWGSFAGNGGGGCGDGIPRICQTNAANAPWGWDDNDDGPINRGDIAEDPIKLVRRYFTNLGDFSNDYTVNPYQ